MKRHTTFFVEETRPIVFCGHIVLWQFTAHTLELPFDIEPTKGEHDFNNCEKCQQRLKTLNEVLKNRFDGDGDISKSFPLCCDGHSQLIEIKDFNRTLYVAVPEMTSRKIIYTIQHIINNYKSDNWFKEITWYIDWVVESFGQLPKGEPLFLSTYFKYIENFVEEHKGIKGEKRDKILGYLGKLQTPQKKQEADLQILASTYEKWLKTFPFEISFFRPLKSYFETHLPLFKGTSEINPYSGKRKLIAHTKSSLIEDLVKTTNNNLTKINSVVLYESGKLTEPQKIQLELIINERKLKLKKGYGQVEIHDDDENLYTKMLEQWYDDEVNFIGKIIPLLKGDILSKSETLDVEQRIKTFSQIRPGNEDAKEFHSSSFNNLIYIFDSRLTNPIQEKEINEGRKRIDIVFDNSDSEGFFYLLNSLHHIKCPKIIVECKNYGNEIGNPEIDQLLGRFSRERGNFGILICRSISDKKLLVNRCKDVMRNGNYILTLDDQDMISMLQFRGRNDVKSIDRFLQSKLDELIM